MRIGWMTYKIGVLVCMMGVAQSVEWSQVWQRLDEMLEYVPFGPEKTDGFLREHTDYKSGSNAVEQ